MIKMFSAFTEEIDDIEAAVTEIMSQLDLTQNQKANTIGLIHCYHEFIDSGVVKALCEKLPFNVAGITVPYVRTSLISSSMGLMLNVLTSDDACFTSGISDSISNGGGNLKQVTDKLSAQIKKGLTGADKPKMLIAYGPFMHVMQIDADEFVGNISKDFPDVPLFGGFSFSEEIDYSECYTLYNGESYENAVCLVALSGDVNPSFLTISVPEENIIGELATVTKSEGNIIHEINGMSVEDHVLDLGLVDEKGNLDKLYTTPMIAKLEDGTTIVRVCIGGDGKGGAIMGGHVPEGARIGLTILELTDALSTSSKIAKEALKSADGRNIIVYTCMARLEFLGANQRELEAKTICDVFGDYNDYFIAYTGGEIFPHKLPDGKYINHLQNFSLIVCLL